MLGEEQAFDVVVLGAGPAGYAAALYGASAGLKVGIVERDRVGGTCLQRGCVPAKEYLETAAVYRNIRSSSEFGITTGEPGLDFAVSQKRKQSVVDKLTSGLSGLMKSRGIVTFLGDGVYQGNGRITVSTGETLVGDKVIISTGSRPRSIPGFEVDGRYVLTSDEVLLLEELPKTVAIVGGGVIGCEFASLMADLGSKVTIVEALPRLLPGVDQDLVDVMVRSFKKRGIGIRTGVGVTGHSPNGEGTTLTLADGSSLAVDQIIVAIGRRPNSEAIFGDKASVVVSDRGFVNVDVNYETSEPGVYAIGDLIDTAQLAHVGFAEGVAVIKTILGEGSLPVDYSRVPWCIYTHPEIAFAGLTEEQARDRGYDPVVKKDPLGGNSRARIIGEVDGFVKVVADRNTHQILGVHIVGPWATELLSPGYLAVNWEASAEELAQFIQPHPTLSEAFGETVFALTGRSLHVG
ncbi:dihydrolipoyl dehydrogenase [Ferrimicrobium acidiphilum]|uniref:Dihydrolipoyl dehydrogenase n=1 Tax=Ferrimicrobium acidiphilum DSM 19497 TaxID=1121877 RepID=A0A0D8FY79_9ACTN|nr:dihydrolipoyl dehydrogenase [Ferrimicrobium acidiphilum]KJE78116.1 dihydrolipoyl dehydrogenase [Ferrimicrobium acidiphilum DSM 19497]MCL5054275.1 dihydrolipoyl dehydrogenase [Gammaproteobacteria bacterium]